MHNRDGAPYERSVLETYGPEVVADLNGLRGSLGKVTDEVLMALLEEYKVMA